MSSAAASISSSSAAAVSRSVSSSVPSFRRFVLRHEVLSLYRSVVRLTRPPLDEHRRREIREHTKWEIRVVKSPTTLRRPHHNTTALLTAYQCPHMGCVP